MRRALTPLPRYLATSSVAKYRTFLWCDARDLPSGRLVVVASDQDWMYGVLNSRIHVVWAAANSSTHGKGNDLTYTSTTCFEPFPFPQWTPATQQGVAEAAQFLEKARAGLKAQGLTITEMYNALGEVTGTASPAYTLKLAHNRLDQAVAAAYGWAWPLTEEELQGRLLELNRARQRGTELPSPPEGSEAFTATQERLLTQVTAVLGDGTAAWFQKPNRHLKEHPPQHYFDDPQLIHELEAYVNSLLNGNFA